MENKKLESKKCFICEKNGQLCEPNLESLEKLVTCVTERAKWKDGAITNLSSRLKSHTAETLSALKIKYHKACYASITNKVQIERAKTRYEKALKTNEESITTPRRGRPKKRESDENLNNETATRKLRSNSTPFDKTKCIICQKDTDFNLHKVEFLEMGKKMLKTSQLLEDKSFFIRMNSIASSDDAVAGDALYHHQCWIYTLRRSQNEVSQNQCVEENQNTITLAKIEIMNTVKASLTSGGVLDMNEINEAYNKLLGSDSIVDYKKELKKLLIENIANVDFTKPPQKNKPEIVTIDKTKDEAACAQFSFEEMSLLFKASKVLRDELLSCKGREWKFKGEFVDFQLPLLFRTFVRWLLFGTKDIHDNINVSTDVENTVNNLCQILLAASKSKRQVEYDHKERGYSSMLETPFTVGVGLYFSNHSRSKELLETLSDLNLSISYDKCNEIQNQIANASCKLMDENNGNFIPPSILKGLTAFFAIDNSDFDDDTPDGKNQFHGTGMVICQETTQENLPAFHIDRSASEKHFQEDRFSEVYQCPAPKLPNLSYEKTKIDDDCLNQFKTNDFIWALRKHFDHESKVPTWAAYNSLVLHPLTKTTCCMLPLLRGSPTKWPNLYTALKLVQDIGVEVSPGSKTIVSCDLQLYNKCLQLKSNNVIADNYIFRLGELHCVFAMLKVIGKYIENSGLDLVFTQADIYGPVTLGQVLDGKHMKRAVEAHTALYRSLLHFLVKFIEQNYSTIYTSTKTIFEDSSDATHDELAVALDHHNLQDKITAVTNSFKTQPQFYHNYMEMFQHLLLFIRSSRQKEWELHLQSLHYFAPLFFAHDQLNYARLTPVYLAEMMSLKTSDHDTWKFLQDGNFCVNKSSLPFCAIGVDHAMEQENKRMKVVGGIKGLTQNQKALDRFVLASPVMTNIIKKWQDHVGLTTDKAPKKHHQLVGSVNERLDGNVSKLVEKMEWFGLSFEESTCVFNIVTKAVAEPETASNITEHYEHGNTLLKQFQEERVFGEKNIWDKMKMRKLSTFRTQTAKLKKKVDNRVISLREEKTLITRFLVMSRQREEIDLEEIIGGYELSVIPKSLFSDDGQPLPCQDKSKIMNKIVKLASELPSQNLQSTEATGSKDVHSVLIIDGMAVVNRIDTEGLKTCKDFAKLFVESIKILVRGYTEVRLIFDRYNQSQSLKSRTRDKRTNGVQIRYKIDDSTSIQGLPLKKFLSHTDTKSDLTKYLSEAAIDLFKNKELKYAVSFENSCASNLEDFHLNKHDHEEADTLILVHAVNVTERNPFSELHISSPDTDVFLLAIHMYPKLCANTTFHNGTGSKYIIGDCYEAIGPKHASALVGFHVFTGCDQIGRFNWKSKDTWWGIFKSASNEELDALSSLGRDKDLPSLETLEGLEKFVTRGYARDRANGSIIELRWRLFSRYAVDVPKLPPTQAALKYRIFRSHFVAMVYKRCINPFQNLPDPQGFGWELEDGRLVPILTDELPAPIGLIELSMCSCKGNCDTNRCICFKHDLNCTDMCKCPDDCENDGSINDEQYHYIDKDELDENI